MRTAFAYLLLPLTAAACGDGSAASTSPDSGPPSTLAVEGAYAVQSPIDLTALALAPQSVVDSIRLLEGLRDDPAGTFVFALDQAGVPLAKDLYGALPGPLESRLNGWINDAILGRSYEGHRLSAELADLVALSEAALLRFDLLTDLSLPARATEPAPLATHVFRGLKYDFLGGRLPVEIPRLVDKHTLVNVETQATARIGAATTVGDAELDLGDHAFGVPYGEYAFAAIDAASTKRYGVLFHPALGKLIDCLAMAASVAGKCIGPACVGHQSELAALCERGVDLVAAKIQDGIRAYNFDAVRFKRGRGQLWDALAGGASDGRVDRIAGGAWEATIDAGMGPREVRATFTGARR